MFDGLLKDYLVASPFGPFNAVVRHSHGETFTGEVCEEETHDHPCQITLYFWQAAEGMGFPIINKTIEATKGELERLLFDTVFTVPNEVVVTMVLDHFQEWIEEYCEKHKIKEKFNTVDFDLASAVLTVNEADADTSHEFHPDAVMVFPAYSKSVLRKYLLADAMQP